MPKFAFKDIDKLYQKLRSPAEDGAGPKAGSVFFMFGEEALYTGILEKLRALLLPASAYEHNYEILEGSEENFPEIIERAHTYSLWSGPRIVVAKNARIFESGKDLTRLWANTRKACDEQKMADAARGLLRIVSLKDLSLQDIRSENRFELLGLSDDDAEDNRWLDEVIAFCVEGNLKVPPPADSAGLLQRAVEKGLPPANHLIITSGAVDKRRSLYKTLVKHAMVIDCSVPAGDRQADKKVKLDLLQQRLHNVLAGNGKSMAKDAFDELLEMTGFDLRLIDVGLEKLITFVGKRKTITRDDVQNVLVRTKQDPIYAFTNAVAERNLKEALFYLNTLMGDGPGALRPEQMLVAVHNQIRKLLLVKDFLQSTLGNSWYPGCPFNLFQHNVLPLVKEYDRMQLERLQNWQAELAGDPDLQGAGKRQGPKLASDVMIAPSGANPYPVYLMMRRAERFSPRDLSDAIGHLSRADRRIKTGGTNKKLILEDLLIRICRRSEPDAKPETVLSAFSR
jgi:DNA polymerase-3 subunit delta